MIIRGHGRSLMYKHVKIDLIVERALCLSAMIASTGCGFTMNVPQLGPIRIGIHYHDPKLRSMRN